MNIKKNTEKMEEVLLSPYAAHSSKSLGRDVDEEPCDIRTVYQRDRDRILHSKSFRRLKQKTQVFLSPEGDHYRTRLTHTLEVSQIARTIARALRLNEDLTEAIALGHDLGHTPFGHAGERALNKVCEGGFYHNVQSVRVVEVLERGGKGLNLTKEVRDGILNHKTSTRPFTLEGCVVRLADKIAYINHDIDDAIRGGVITEEQIPKEFRQVLGMSTKDRLDCLIHDIVFNSLEKDGIFMSEEVETAMYGLRSYMFENVYRNPVAKAEEGKAEMLVITLFEYYMEHLSELPEEYSFLMETCGESPNRAVCDYISGMSDRFAVSRYQELFVPMFWK